MIEETKIGIAKLLHTTNEKFKCYEGKRGQLRRVDFDEGYLYILDMVRYWLKTSLVQNIEFKDATTQTCRMIVTTLNSVYQFKLYLSETKLSFEDLIRNFQNKPAKV